MSETESVSRGVFGGRIDRRKALAALGSAAAAVNTTRADGSGVPLVPFGAHRVSRLIVGGNPVSANSHVSRDLSLEMMDYFTSDRIKAMLRRCEEAGINTWQSRA